MSGAPTRLSRWSRLKAESRAGARGMKFTLPGDSVPEKIEDVVQEEPAASEAAETPTESVVEAPSVAAGQQAEADADLPDVDDLNAESDFTPFMSDKVSDAVRNMALRKLWRTDAVFANLDGLLDYGEDFTDAATVVAGMQSVYKVGRGMVDYEAEEAAKAAEADAAAIEEEEIPAGSDIQEQGVAEAEETEPASMEELEAAPDGDLQDEPLETAEILETEDAYVPSGGAN